MWGLGAVHFLIIIEEYLPFLAHPLPVESGLAVEILNALELFSLLMFL